MKKILLTIPLLFILLFMMGCEPSSNQTDFIAPSFQGGTSFFYEFGDELPDYTEYFTATDEVDGDVTSLIQFNDSEINYLVLGTYSLSLTLSDLSGNTANLVISVHVQDTKAPLIFGDTEISYSIGDERPDYASLYTATDVFDGNLSSEINFNDSAVDFTVSGMYELILSVTDTSSNQASMTVEITVNDIDQPVILGADEITYEIGEEQPDYKEYFTASDAVDGDISSLIVYDESEIDYLTVGIYELFLTVSDLSGNTANLLIPVHVLDTKAPLITGDQEIIYNTSDALPDYASLYEAIDAGDGNLSSEINFNDDAVDFTVPGTYELILTVTDASNNQATLIVDITVIDNENPVILGAVDITYEIGEAFPDYTEYFTASDEVEGDITSLILYNESEIDYLTVGTYELFLTVSDLSGNTADLVIPVHVLDTTAPVITGNTELIYNIGDALPDYTTLYAAIDAGDGDLSSEINFNDHAVDFAVPGTYELLLSVTDTFSNQASMIVEITVGDFGNPVIIGAVDISYEIGDTVPDYLFGIMADDVVEGDLTHELILDSSLVNLDVPGVYTLVYTVTDGSNNTYSVTVSVFVVDPNYIAPIDQLNIFYINDLHGALSYEGEQMGLARIGNLVLDERSKNPDTTLFIGGGDLLQGTLISNYFEGSSTINVLNTIGMDAFVLGNHEFDWGLPIVTRYRDPLYTNDQVDAPIIGANIFLDGTQTRPEFVDPYTIIQKGNIKVGIIGVMGYGLESSIAVSKIQGYYFASPEYWATYYTEYLRSVEQVDIVLVVLHDNGISTDFNETMSQLTGNQKVDAVFNGHSHSSYTGSLPRTGTTSMPYIQSSSNGKNLGRVRLLLDSDGQITSASATNLTPSNDARLSVNNALISSVIQSYEAQIQPLLTEVIMVSGAYMSTSSLSYYMAKLMRVATDSDVAFHNLGGTRAPIYNGQDITVATLYQIFPFDNKIKTTYLTGAQINSFLSSSGGAYNDIRDNMSFNSTTYYKVATNDYMFDQTYNPFITGIDSEDTGILIRDVLESVLRNQAESYDVFLLSNPIEVGTVHQNNIYYLELKKILDQISL